MTLELLCKIQSIVEPLLVDLGFQLEEFVYDIDEGGPKGAVAYYRSRDCKIQVYYSSRSGEFNCMIAPLKAANIFGLYDPTGKWQYFTQFTKRPYLPLAELIKLVRSEHNSYADPLEWVRDRIANLYEAAHDGILEMFRTE